MSRDDPRRIGKRTTTAAAVCFVFPVDAETLLAHLLGQASALRCTFHGLLWPCANDFFSSPPYGAL
eukprot:1242441-Amphidinium_carterae.3